MAIQINFAKIDAEAIIDSTFDFSLVVCVLFPFFIISLSVNFFCKNLVVCDRIRGRRIIHFLKMFICPGGARN